MVEEEPNQDSTGENPFHVLVYHNLATVKQFIFSVEITLFSQIVFYIRGKEKYRFRLLPFKRLQLPKGRILIGLCASSYSWSKIQRMEISCL
jgi:hypothetical protein